MSDRELSDIDELAEIEDRTNEDGTVDVTIEDWHKDGNKVMVKFELIDSIKQDIMHWPEPGEGLEDGRFYRLIRQSGLTMRNADLLNGNDARARKVNGSWKLDIPQVESRQEKIDGFLHSLWQSVCTAPVSEIAITLLWTTALLTIIYILLLIT